jgi:hypothetical protein
MFDFHCHHYHSDGELRRALKASLRAVKELALQGVIPMSIYDDLEAAEAAENTVAGKVIAYLAGVPALIAAAGTDMARLSALKDKIAAAMQTALDSAPPESTP